MNKAMMLLLFAVPLSFSSMIYTVETDRSGASSATLSIQGGQEALVPLPEDAVDFRMVGGSYSFADGLAEILPGPSGFATFSFSTRFFTSKSGSGWTMSFNPPQGAAVTIIMPPHSAIESVSPQPDSVSAEDSRAVIKTRRPGTVEVHYRLDEIPAEARSDMPLYLLAAAIAVLAAVLAYSAFRSSGIRRASGAAKQEMPTLALTSGKKEMMETLNENDARIVQHLLANEGKSRRNELERRCGISKSSLAVALNRLEKRRMIEMDRSSTTHFVKLSERFLKM